MKNKLLFGIQLARNSFLTLYMYRSQIFSKIIYGILLYITQLCIWISLNNSSVKMLFDIEAMHIYVVASSLIGVFIGFDTNYIPVIGNRIRSGEIAADLTKPYSFFYLMFCQYMGKCVFKLIFQFFPQLLIIFVISNVDLSISCVNIIFFAVSVMLSILMFFGFCMVFGVISFWVISIGNLHIFLDSSITLFGGTIIPIWMLPSSVRRIYEILPFQYLFYKPICILLNQFDSFQEIILIYLLQLGWVAGLMILASLLFRQGVRKILLFGV